jgi:hypothetical protein
MPTGVRRPRTWCAAMIIAVSCALTGCGEDTSPAEAAPVLAQRLDRVDAAIAADDPVRARKAVEALIDAAAQARVDGKITGDQADAILRAAGELLRRLPEADQEREPSTPSETPTEPPPTPEPDTSEEGEEDEGEGDDKEDKDDEDKKDKDKEDKEEGGGNGPSGENGPDDGHGH